MDVDGRTWKLSQEPVAEHDHVGFKRNAIGWTLTVANTLSALWSTFVFLVLLRTGVVGWVMLNTCAPCIYLFVIGFLFKNPVVMVASSVLMLRYGTGGLFAFGWDAYSLPMQIGHILMTLAGIYVGATLIRRRAWKTLAWGIVLGLVILVPLMLVQGWWFSAHPETLELLFSGDWGPPGQ